MPYCAVPGCTNGTRKGNTNPPGVGYHRLPGDQKVADQWWQIVRREGAREGVKDPRICSTHFPTSSFKTHECPPNIQSVNRRRSLLPSAVPCLLIPTSHPSVWVPNPDPAQLVLPVYNRDLHCL